MSVRDPSALDDTIHSGRPAAPGEIALEPGALVALDAEAAPG